MITPELRQRLLKLSTAQIKQLAVSAAVSERALWNVRSGHTKTASEALREAVKKRLPKSKAVPAISARRRAPATKKEPSRG